MALQINVIDRLFLRLTTTYGSSFSNKWDGVEINDLKSSWAHELSGFDNALHSIAWALENLPEKAPNVIEFRNLCRRAPALETQRLPGPVADKSRVDAELAKLAPLRALVTGRPQVDMKAWAYRLKARHDAGDRLNINQIKCYLQALREIA